LCGITKGSFFLVTLLPLVLLGEGREGVNEAAIISAAAKRRGTKAQM